MKTYKLYFRENNGEWKVTYAAGRTAKQAASVVANHYYIDINNVVVA